MIELTPHPRGVVLGVKAQPGAKRNAILGERAGALRVAVTAAPERGKANEAVAEVLAKALELKSSQIKILAGETSRNKRFLIEDVERDVLAVKIEIVLIRESAGS